MSDAEMFARLSAERHQLEQQLPRMYNPPQVLAAQTRLTQLRQGLESAIAENRGTDNEGHDLAAGLIDRLAVAVDGHDGDDCQAAFCLRDDLVDLAHRLRSERSALTRRVVAVLLGERDD